MGAFDAYDSLATRARVRLRLFVAGLVAALVLASVVACSRSGRSTGDGAVEGTGAGGRAETREAVRAPATDPAILARNVVIISLDTVRADRLETYGYDRATSPNVEALSRRAVVFEHAQAQSSQTAPSHASLFTSTYAGAHGIVNAHGQSTEVRELPPGVTTLAELARGAGLETAAFVSGGNLTRKMAMHRGFDAWDERNEDIAARVDALLSWIAEPRRGRFLAVLHSYQAHAPYLPPAELIPAFTSARYEGPLRERTMRYLSLPESDAWLGAVGPDYWEGMLEYTPDDVRFLSDLYDAEIAYADSQLRRLLEVLLTGELGAGTAVILLSDHGEEFRDHGKFQHDQVYEELLRVPLIIRLPAALERSRWTGRVDRPVELVDVAPTVAEMLGIDWSTTGWSGRSLVPLLDPARRAAGLPARPRFSELTVDPGPKRYGTVSWQGWKYIHAHQQDLDVTWEWLFDLRSDPGETINLVASTEDEAVKARRGLKQLLEDRRSADRDRSRALGDAASSAIEPEQRAELLKLGY